MTDKIGSVPKFQMDQRKTGKKKKRKPCKYFTVAILVDGNWFSASNLHSMTPMRLNTFHVLTGYLYVFSGEAHV